MEDSELLGMLEALDESEHDVTSWEAGFIESILYEWPGSLTAAQRATIHKLIEKYDI